MDTQNIDGYTLTEVNDIAKDLVQLLAEEGVNPRLGLLALCRSITIIGSPTDLDLACRIIDDFSSIPPDGTTVAGEVWDDEDSDDDWAV